MLLKIIMKRSVIIFTLFLCSIAGRAEDIKGTDSRINYIGRVERNDAEGKVSFDWSATTLKVRFSGSNLYLKCSDSKKDYLNLWVDKVQGPKQDKTLYVEGDTLLCLFQGRKGIHEVILQKRTEGEQGCITIEGLSTNGKFLDAPASKPRIIEFVGDSYTCGYGTEAPDRSVPFYAKDENPALTYADILGRYFNAEAIHISHSGRGVIRNYDDFNQHENMTTMYTQAFNQYKTDKWEPTYHPDLVVVYLGTNDFSTGKQPSLWAFCGQYKTLLQEIREFHPYATILCISSKIDEQMAYYVSEAVKRSDMAGVYSIAIQNYAHNDDSDLGASWHPNYNGHRKIAGIIAPYISTIMNWEMPYEPYE